MIDIYFIDVNVADDVIEQLAELLTDDERTRANRYRFADDRRRSIVARAGTRRLAGRALGVDPRALVIVEEEHGKPALRNRAIEFNASHSGDLVALAFANDTPVGIDVERRRHINDAAALAHRFFAAEELQIVANATDSDDAFLTIWTAKEAILKASGKGIGAGDLRGFAVPFGNCEMRPVINGWFVAALETPLIGYHAAIAARSDEHRIDSRKITAAALI